MKNTGTILIVEDNELNATMIKELLEEVGFQTLEAGDADTSLRLAKQQHPDLILMDVYLPGKNGYEASLALKADSETQSIPIVAFTALAMEKDRQRAEAAGCIGVISKPIDVDTFATSVMTYLQSSKTDTIGLTSSPMEFWSPSGSPGKEVLMKLSHDLQGPIRKINQFTSWLRKSKAESMLASDQDYINGIERATQQMQNVLSKALSELHK